MNIFKNLEINDNNPFLCVVSSLSAVGKTSVLMSMAMELANKNNRVLFITDEVTDSFNNGNIFIIGMNEIKTNLHEIANINEFGYIMIDTSISKDIQIKLFDELRRLVNNGVRIVVSVQLIRLVDTFPLISNLTHRVVSKSDYVIILSKYFKLSIFERIKYFFFGNKPNLNINLAKNRIFLDFKKIKNEFKK